jgi:hypothetical protein
MGRYSTRSDSDRVDLRDARLASPPGRYRSRYCTALSSSWGTGYIVLVYMWSLPLKQSFDNCFDQSRLYPISAHSVD